jgi:glutamyl-tRNA synthetase
MASGRFAPSPSGPLHVGNLRTALAAWAFARSRGSRFTLRIEDLDRRASRPEHERAHQRDLAALGIDWDGPAVRQSERFGLYEAALASLGARGLTYPCYCTRREVRDAVSAPHGPAPEGAYPGTCARLTQAERAERERAGRQPAWRLRAGGAVVAFIDRRHGSVEALVDDFVLRRNDGAPAYNLAVVVDDADQGVEEVVRGDDLLLSTPRQIHLGRLLDLPIPSYAHVPLVLGADGERLAKRHGAVTLSDLAAIGCRPDDVRTTLAASLGVATGDGPVSITDVAARFEPERIPNEPWVFTPPVR